MSIEITLLISIAGLCGSILFGALSARRGSRQEVQREAADMTTIAVKLENINNGVSEIKSDLRNMKEDAKELRERLVVVEQSAKQAHKRLDTLIKQGG